MTKMPKLKIVSTQPGPGSSSSREEAALLRSYPQIPSEVWQAGLVRLPVESEVWCGLCLDPRSRRVATAGPARTAGENPALVRSALLQAARELRLRPGRVLLGSAALAEELAGFLAEAGIQGEIAGDLPELWEAQDMLVDALGGGAPARLRA